MSTWSITLWAVGILAGCIVVLVIFTAIQVWWEGKTFLSDEARLKLAIKAFNQGHIPEEDLLALDVHKEVEFISYTSQSSVENHRLVYRAEFVPKKKQKAKF